MTLAPSSSRGSSGGGGFSAIADSVAGGTVASFDFSGIVQTYKHLLLIWQVVDAGGAGSFQPLTLRFNADSGANYDSQLQQATNATTTTVASVGAAAMALGDYPGSGAPDVGSGMLWIVNYAATTLPKTVNGQGSAKTANVAAGLELVNIAGWWRSTAAITEVTLLPNATGFAAGSRATLYGLS